MTRETYPGDAPASSFGPIDPFCWLPVASMLIVAVALAFGGGIVLGVGIVVCAVLLLAYDSWVNRPRPETAARARAARERQRPAGRDRDRERGYDRGQNRAPARRRPPQRRDEDFW